MSRPITVEDPSKSSSEQPSMVGAHARYVQGAVASTLGYQSGEQTKQDAVQDMRKANENRGTPQQSSILGTVEKAAGDLTGCEGMSNEGESRKPGTGVAGGQTG
ncbi:hypothetical protein LTR64_003729 [Lithohypha guttulata]|uniref:uncharacterized protein n=1 Tax=Lithohypha guttulata TaxID=1690604 RepID=UPI002DDEFF7D|nr:hypothetical protein LTR51_000051 [Lithohypha guttulata]